MTCLRSVRGYKIPLPLQDEDSLLHGHCPVFWRSVDPAIQLGIVRLILFENVVNGSEQHSGDSNNRFLVTSALFDREVPIADFRVVFGAYSTKCTLNKQRF